MSLRSVLSGIRRQTLCSFHSRRVSLGDLGPVVSFTFDDFPRTAYTVGGAILKSVNARGTYYTAPGLMGTTNHLGEQFSSEDVKSLLNDGHELASHTFSHISARKVSSKKYSEDVERGRKSIEGIAGFPDSGNFAYPYGDLTLATKKILGPTLRSSRSIFPGLNGPEVDLNLLLANSLYGDDNQIGNVQELILENEKRKTWLIFYTHDVRTEPSRYGCTPSLLEAAASFSCKRGSQVLPVGTVLAEIGVTCPVSVPVASS